jgi:hypothetical protein
MWWLLGICEKKRQPDSQINLLMSSLHHHFMGTEPDLFLNECPFINAVEATLRGQSGIGTGCTSGGDYVFINGEHFWNRND